MQYRKPTVLSTTNREEVWSSIPPPCSCKEIHGWFKWFLSGPDADLSSTGPVKSMACIKIKLSFENHKVVGVTNESVVMIAHFDPNYRKEAKLVTYVLQNSISQNLFSQTVTSFSLRLMIVTFRWMAMLRGLYPVKNSSVLCIFFLFGTVFLVKIVDFICKLKRVM